MKKQAELMIQTAVSYAGYLEKATNSRLEEPTANAGSGNYTLFGQWYSMNGCPWCAMFVSYCADKAGIATDIIPKHASCAMGVSWFRRAGRWHPREGFIPEPGDIVYFTHDGETPAHVGIVTRVLAGRVHTIEGNTSGGASLIANGGAVAEKSYPLTYKSILGYGKPEYEEDADMTIEEVKKDLTSVKGTGTAHSAWAGDAVRALTGAGVVNGDGLGNYGWGQCITREGAAQLLYNLLERLNLLDALKKEGSK